ncbi:hypothetical protein C8Q74DRAFT_1211390 [Fomes fomentarius]|nr:hypothetical protein C8Q74DRAFT_1211390 [Fomes fomentarius]
MSTWSISTTPSPLPVAVAFAATFPVEVEERIIDKLHYHIDALQKCALTCRRWLPRTRYHLFVAIRVRTRDELFSLNESLSGSPHLRQLVRSLTLRAQRDWEGESLFQIVPVSLLTSLSNLICWRLCGTGYDTSSDGKIKWEYTLGPYRRTGLATIRRLATTVRELHLDGVSFISPVDCARLVSSLPALRELRCVNVTMLQEPEVVNTCIDRLIPSLHIESLSVGIPTSLCTLKLTAISSLSTFR